MLDLSKHIKVSKSLEDENKNLSTHGKSLHPISPELIKPAELWRVKLVAKARDGVKASWSENISGYSSKWVRQVAEHTYGYTDYGLFNYFGSTAIETGRKLRSLSLVLPGTTQLLPGDILLQEEGSAGDGHIAIYLGGNQVAENSLRNKGPDGRGITTLELFGKITGVARLDDITNKK